MLQKTKRLPLFVRKPFLVVYFAFVLSSLTTLSIFAVSPPADASAPTLNFQARLLASSGAIVSDGDYNVEFKIYSGSSCAPSTGSGCTADWTEDYFGGTTDNRLRVADGYLTANLGSLTPFSSNIPWGQPLWLSINIGGTTDTSSPTLDGAMFPYLTLTSVPAAMALNYTDGTHTGTLAFTPTLSGNDTITLPDDSGTVCLAISGGGNCSGSGSGYILNQSGTTQTGNFNISGTGIAGTLQATTFDTASAGTLNIGTTNATGITIGSTSETGTVTLGHSTATNTIDIGNGNTATGDTQIINIGDGTDAGTGDATVTIGNQGGVSTTTVQGGTGGVGIQSASTGTISVGTTNANIITVGNTSSTDALTLQGEGISQTITGGATPSDVIKTTTNSTTAFQVQNASSYSLFTADTSDADIILGQASHVTGNLQFANASSSYLVTLNAGNTSGAYTLTLPTSGVTGAECLVSGSGSTTSSTSLTFSSCLNGGSYINNQQTAQAANLYVQAATSGTVAGTFQANATGAGDILDLLNGSGVAVSTFSSAGAVLLKPSTNSTSAFQIQPSGSTIPVVDVDTTDSRVGVNTNSPAYALDVNGAINSNTSIDVNGISICTASCTPSAGSGNYVQNSTSVQVSANFFLRSASSGATVGVLQGAIGQSADLLDLQTWNGTSSTTVDKIDSSGDLTINESSSNALQIQNGSSVSLLTVNTSGATINVGVTGSTNLSSTTNIGTGTGAGQTVNIASGAITSGTDTVNIGTGTTSSGSSSVTIGGTTAGSQTKLQGGSASLTITNTGGVAIQGADSTNSTTAFSVANSGSANIMQALDDGTIDLGLTSGGGSSTYGYSTQGSNAGSNYYQNGGDILSAVQFKATSGGTISSLSTYVDGIHSGDEYQMAVYTDNGGVPGNYVASTNATTLTANGWNTASITSGTAALTSGSLYWLVYWTNLSTSGNSNDGQAYNTGVYCGGSLAANCGYFDTYDSGTGSPTFGLGSDNGMPATFPTSGATAGTFVFSIYANYSTSGTTPVIINSSGSLTASLGESIGSGSTGEASGQLLTLDSDTQATYSGGTASNAPTEVNGAMFYSSTNHDFMCGVAGAWEACTGLLYSNTSVGSAVDNCTTTCGAVGSAPIPANYCQAGRVIHLLAKGTWGDTTTAPTLGFEVKYGTSTTQSSDTLVGAETPAVAGTSTSSSGMAWNLDLTIICFSSSSMNIGGTYILQPSTTTTTTNIMTSLAATTTSSLTTTSSSDLYLFPEFGTGNTSNSATLSQLIVTGN